MMLETIRTAILATGWPLLIAGSIYILTKAWLLYDESEGLLLARLVFPTTLGWLVTMYSLGIVATFYMFDHLPGTIVVLPVFLIWFITFVSILVITLRWSKEAIAFQKEHRALEVKLQEQKTFLENTQKREKELAERVEDIIRLHHEMVEKVESPLNAILWSMETLLAQKDALPEGVATKLENARERAEELKSICASITKPRV